MALLLVAEVIYFAYFTTVLLLSLPTEMEAASNCSTTDGRQCILPFKFLGDGRWHNECTWEYAFYGQDYRNGNAWCGTQKTADVWVKDTWGDCGDGCHIPGKKINSRSVRMQVPIHLWDSFFEKRHTQPKCHCRLQLYIQRGVKRKEGSHVSFHFDMPARNTTSAPGPTQAPKETESPGVQHQPLTMVV